MNKNHYKIKLNIKKNRFNIIKSKYKKKNFKI